MILQNKFDKFQEKKKKEFETNSITWELDENVMCIYGTILY